jgi:ubiquitin C-terminal hydrolase
MERVRVDCTSVLSLTIPSTTIDVSVTLQDVLDSRHTCEECVIDCPDKSCNGTTAICDWSVTEWPDVMLLHLNRLADAQGCKLSTPISPTQLLTVNGEKATVTYQLQSMVFHAGSASAGHYTTVTRCGGLWVLCNDSNVCNCYAVFNPAADRCNARRPLEHPQLTVRAF